MSSRPLETHVFLWLQDHVPFYVIVPHGSIWLVDQGTITRMNKSHGLCLPMHETTAQELLDQADRWLAESNRLEQLGALSSFQKRFSDLLRSTRDRLTRRLEEHTGASPKLLDSLRRRIDRFQLSLGRSYAHHVDDE